MSGAEVLEVEGLGLAFGSQQVVDDVSFSVGAAELVGLVGPNGAGKTSILNCLSGIYRPHSGSARLGGHDLLATPAVGRGRLGLGRTFQHMQLLDEHTVLENVLVGRHARMRGGILLDALFVGWSSRQEKANRGAAEAALERCGLLEQRGERISGLPYGARKRVDVARALAGEPTVLLLDEPMAGLDGAERRSMAAMVGGLAEDGLTMVMIEHDIEIIRALSHRIVVLDQGRVLATGAPEEVLALESVRDAYLGLGRAEQPT